MSGLGQYGPEVCAQTANLGCGNDVPIGRARRLLAGLADFAIVASYLSTATKWGLDTIDVLRQLFTTGPWLPPALHPAE